jgi:hypothetical protein
MTTTAPALQPMTRAEAEELVARVRQSFDVWWNELGVAYRRSAHVALGYPETATGWEEFVARTFPEVKVLRLPAEHRLAKVVQLRKDGAPVRVIASGTGVGAATTQADLAKARERGLLTEDDERTTKGRDGISRPGRSLRPVKVQAVELSPRWEALRRVARAEDVGLTSLELDKGWRQPIGTATGSLSKLAARGYIAIDPELPRRDNRGAYRVTDAGRARLARLPG